MFCKKYILTTDNIGQNLESLRKEMARVKRLRFFTRNSPRNRDKFYYLFELIIGEENMKRLLPDIRNAHRSAALDFDRLYGLVQAASRVDVDALMTKEPPAAVSEEEQRNKQIARVKQYETLAEELCKLKKQIAELCKEDSTEDNISPGKQLAEISSKLNAQISKISGIFDGAFVDFEIKDDKLTFSTNLKQSGQ